MTQFVAFAPNAEVNGETVLSIVDGMGIFKPQAIDILSKNGINNPTAGQWYKQQDWLNSFKEISMKIGVNTLFQIGLKIPENAQWPPQVKTIDQALGSIDVAYHMNHRQGEIGNYKFNVKGPKLGVMVCNNPYPCDFDRGIIESVAKKFKPPKTIIVKVKHDDTKPCRKKGDESCTYNIGW